MFYDVGSTMTEVWHDDGIKRNISATPENKQQRRNGRKTMEVIFICGSLNASAAEKLSVIKVLTAADSDIAPFCDCPVTPLNEISNGPGCHAGS